MFALAKRGRASVIFLVAVWAAICFYTQLCIRQCLSLVLTSSEVLILRDSKMLNEKIERACSSCEFSDCQELPLFSCLIYSGSVETSSSSRSGSRWSNPFALYKPFKEYCQLLGCKVGSRSRAALQRSFASDSLSCGWQWKLITSVRADQRCPFLPGHEGPPSCHIRPVVDCVAAEMALMRSHCCCVLDCVQ